MQEMKPCVWPGCNGEAVLGYFQKLDPLKVTVTKYHGKCLKCGMKGPEADTKEEALAAWNRRDPWISVEDDGFPKDYHDILWWDGKYMIHCDFENLDDITKDRITHYLLIPPTPEGK